MAELLTAGGGSGRDPESPRSPDTLKSITAFARFEFEAGKGNDGTKILMVEWEDDDVTRGSSGTWQVSWSRKTTVLPADERTSENTRRFYFLLPPGTHIPPHITLTYHPSSDSTATLRQPLKLTVNPLPAIFPPELGATAKTSGKKGVLHTIWAKKRLQVLEKEIRQEEELNIEGVALEMALSEKQWIETNFGVMPKLTSIELNSLPKFSHAPLSPALASPKSPGGGRLSEKLRGLSLGTSEKDLAGRLDAANTPSNESHPLSPESSDVAFSSFTSFRNTPISTTSSAGKTRIVSQPPPDNIRFQQWKSPMASMDFVPQQDGKESGGDELFAKALSPRTPDIPKSPFSFSSADTMPFSKIKGEQ